MRRRTFRKFQVAPRRKERERRGDGEEDREKQHLEEGPAGGTHVTAGVGGGYDENV